VQLHPTIVSKLQKTSSFRIIECGTDINILKLDWIS
jgi:hypothetical protein